jgi:hypothetical protein
MAASNYQMWGEALGTQYVDIETQDWFPFHNQWRGQPLDINRAWIKDNAAGFYPYVKAKRAVKPREEPVWNYTWYYPCSTIFPSNPQFLQRREIILER